MMKIAIVGETERATAWEKYIRAYRSVEEVIITSRLRYVGDADACVLLDDSEERLDKVLKIVKLGYPTYLVSRLSCDTDLLRKIHAASQESGVPVQFSHWPTLAASTHWMRQQIQRPEWFTASKQLISATFSENVEQIRFHWIDEIALISKWMDSSVQRVSAQSARVQGNLTGVTMLLHFENGGTAFITLSLVSSSPSHTRSAGDSNVQLECDVVTQQVRSIGFSEGSHLTIRKQNFDASGTAEMSVGRFLKSVQNRKPVSYSVFDALRTARIVEMVDRQLGGPQF